MVTAQQHYDVVVIGAGIHGAGIAQLYALNGCSVLLVEQYTIGSQTSSRSSKLVHGGLRYLETFQFNLVRECLRERQTLLRIAPNLVRLVPFYIPVYTHTTRSSRTIRAGLSLYALLGNLQSAARFRRLPADEWSTLDGLSTNALKAVYQYYDAQTDDLALTRAVVRSARRFAAESVENTRMVTARYDDARWHIVLRQQTQTTEVTTKLLINAAGAWVNQVQRMLTPDVPRMGIEWVQGTHIELDRPAHDRIYYVEAPQDQRAVFIMPWHGHTLVGTTETAYQGDPAAVTPLPGEVDYLKTVFDSYFPTANAQVIGSFAGLRILPKSGTNAFTKPRDTRLLYYPANLPNYVGVYGGKLTSYRLTALKVFKLTRAALGFSGEFRDSATIVLE